MPSFQSPVPNSGRPCEPIARLESSASAQCAYSGSEAVGFGRAEQLLLAGRERPALEKGDRFVEQGEVLRHLEVMSHHVGQPDPIIGDARLDAPCP